VAKADRLKAGDFNLAMEIKKEHTKKLSKVKKYFSKTQVTYVLKSMRR
jgi:hypothetical protein